eukprot:2408624-Pyramimonas_sp.AAC.1
MIRKVAVLWPRAMAVGIAVAAERGARLAGAVLCKADLWDSQWSGSQRAIASGRKGGIVPARFSPTPSARMLG